MRDRGSYRVENRIRETVDKLHVLPQPSLFIHGQDDCDATTFVGHGFANLSGGGLCAKAIGGELELAVRVGLDLRYNLWILVIKDSFRADRFDEVSIGRRCGGNNLEIRQSGKLHDELAHARSSSPDEDLFVCRVTDVRDETHLSAVSDHSPECDL